MKYFKDEIDYPEYICENPIPWNVRINYVSNSFLDGFINYCKIIKSYATDDDLLLESEILEEIKKEHNHTKIGCLSCNCLILGKIKSGYIFFWYNPDNSDCSIGKFRTNDPEKNVKNEFYSFVKELNYNFIVDVPLEYFAGWISQF